MAKTDCDLGLDWLFVDEGQDLSRSQWKLIDRMMERIPHVVIAGDDDQAIYTWAGADPHGMKKYGEGKVLDVSYRVPRKVHRIAEAVAEKMGERVAKSYRPANRDGSVDLLSGFNYCRVDRDANSVLLLYRNNAFRAEAEEWLIREREPYTVTG